MPPTASLYKRALALVRQSPVTWGGLLIVVIATWALVGVGLKRMDLIVLVVSAIALLLFAASGVCTILGAVLMRRARPNFEATTATELESGYASRTGFSTPALSWIPFVTIEWKWTLPEAKVTPIRRDGRWLEDVTPQRRAVATQIRRDFEVRDIFGFWRVRFKHEERIDVRVVPSTGKLRHSQVVHAMTGGADLSHPTGSPTGDRIDMRHYAPGDPIRFILWKVYAKTRELMIRVPERAISPKQQTVAYLVASKGDEPAAGTARTVIDGGALGEDWILGADGSSDTATEMTAALDLLARSSGTPDADGGAGLAPFLNGLEGGTMSRAILFVPAIPGPWIQRVIAVSGGSSALARLEILVCTDGFVEPEVLHGWRKLAFEPSRGNPDLETTQLATVKEVLMQLRDASASVTLVDRMSGQIFASEQVLA